MVYINQLGIDIKRSGDMQEKLNHHYEQLGVKPKSNNVKMMEFVISASPEFFGEWHRNQKIRISKKDLLSDWLKTNLAFLKDEFGTRLQLVVGHYDEKTPHLHCMISTEKKSVKKYRNQFGEFFKETYSLAVDHITPEYLIGLHNRHAKANAKFGLRRGIRGSQRKHRHQKEYDKAMQNALEADYGEIAQAILSEIREKSKGAFGINLLSEETVTNLIKGSIGKLEKEQACLREQVRFNYEHLIKKITAKQEKIDAELVDLESRREIYAEQVNATASREKYIRQLEYEKSKLLKRAQELEISELEKISILIEHGLIEPPEGFGKDSKTGRSSGAKFPKPSPIHQK